MTYDESGLSLLNPMTKYLLMRASQDNLFKEDGNDGTMEPIYRQKD